jgi:hypothetical protein
VKPLIRAFDSGGDGFDRYTVVYLFDPQPRNHGPSGKPLYACVGLSGHGDATLGRHLGREIDPGLLPLGLRRTVARDLAAYARLGDI